MLKRNARVIEASLLSIDVAGLAATFPIAYAIRERLGTSLPDLLPLQRYWPLVAETLVLWLAAASVMTVYGSYRTRGLRTELFRLAKALVAVAIGLRSLAVRNGIFPSLAWQTIFFDSWFVGSGHSICSPLSVTAKADFTSPLEPKLRKRHSIGRTS